MVSGRALFEALPGAQDRILGETRAVPSFDAHVLVRAHHRDDEEALEPFAELDGQVVHVIIAPVVQHHRRKVDEPHTRPDKQEDGRGGLSECVKLGRT